MQETEIEKSKDWREIFFMEYRRRCTKCKKVFWIGDNNDKACHAKAHIPEPMSSKIVLDAINEHQSQVKKMVSEIKNSQFHNEFMIDGAAFDKYKEKEKLQQSLESSSDWN